MDESVHCHLYVLWRLPVRAVIFIRAEYARVKGMLSDSCTVRK